MFLIETTDILKPGNNPLFLGCQRSLLFGLQRDTKFGQKLCITQFSHLPVPLPSYAPEQPLLRPSYVPTHREMSAPEGVPFPF